MDVGLLYGKHGIQPLCLRHREHISCFMYRQSKIPGILDPFRPPINLRSNKKVKFKKDNKYNVRVWDMLPATVQKATTKVKFKTLIKKICRNV